MKTLCCLTLLLLGAASAQSVRNLGMGGVTLPEQGNSGGNPAFKAYPSPFGADEGFSLPLGLFGLYQMAQKSPDGSLLDVMLFDQAAHLTQYTFYRDFEGRYFKVDGSDPKGTEKLLTLLQGFQGNATNGVQNGFTLSFPLGDNFSLEVGPHFEAQLGKFTFSDSFKQGLKPNTTYTTQGELNARATVDLGATLAMPLWEDDTLKVYGGVKARAFYGALIYQNKFMLETTTDSEGNPIAEQTKVNSTAFGNIDPYQPGFGGSLDLGVAAEVEGITVGVAARNLVILEQWNGTTTVQDGDKTTKTPDSRRTLTSQPEVLVNVALPLKLGEDVLILAADSRFNLNQAFSAHAGAEYQMGSMRLRGGVGYTQNQVSAGAGFGVDLDGLGFDVAFTTRQALITREMVYGISAGLKFKF